MIISDAHRFVFVHVPKCAGSTVRARVQHLDDTGGRFTDRVETHPELGPIDWVHIPLFVLREHFPEEYRKVSDYAAFALVRDPFERFPSALFQRLRMYGSTLIQEMAEGEIRDELESVIRVLAGYDDSRSYLPPEYIHFQRQVDFISDRGQQTVGNVYTIDRVDALVADLGARAGVRLAPPEERVNRTTVYASETVRRAVESARSIAQAVVPERARAWVWKRLVPHLHVPREQRFRTLFESDRVRDFVRSYYAADIDRYETVVAAGGVTRREG